MFPVAVAHALTRAERQGRISPADGWSLWLSVLADCPQLVPSLAFMPRAYAASSAARIGIYDCLYIALAERESCQLVTADDRLVRTLSSQFPFIVPLSSLA